MRRVARHIATVVLLWSAAPSAARAQVVINEVLASNLTTNPDMVDHGDFEDWVELYNAGSTDADLSGFALSDGPAPVDPWRFPAGTVLAPGAHLLVWADGRDDVPGTLHVRSWWPYGQTFISRRLHADFRLNQDGEGVWLFDPFGALADSVTFGPQLTDVSLGRRPDGAGAWSLFAEPTPLAPNDGVPLVDPTPAPAVVAEPAGGFFAGSVQVALAAGPAAIRYTTDGSVPDSRSPLYAGPIPVTQTTVLRARTFDSGRLPGPVTTQSYFVGESRNLPVVSIAAEPPYLWDRDLGIYLNSYREREIPVGFEYFPDGKQVLSVQAGMRIGGENIYRFAQKPLNLYFRSDYGASRLDWPVFDDLPYFEYKRLYVRNGGDDWPGTLYRDGLVRELVKDHVRNATQAFRPAVAYLNGAYWGIHNLREKIDERWFELHHSVRPEDLDHLEADGTVIAGDSTDFMDLVAMARTTDLSDAVAYAGFENRVDVDDLIDFAVVQAVIANPSWSHNREVWRDRGRDGRWRWVLVDNDRGFDTGRLADDMLRSLAEEFEIFGAALANASFRERFLRRLALHLNTTFRPDLVIGRIDSIRAILAPEIPRHAARWSAYIDSLTIDVWGRTPGIQSLAAWEADVDELRDFATNRPPRVFDRAASLFGLDGTARLAVRAEPPGHGRVRVEGERIDQGDWFRGVPVALEATAPPGFAFVRWIERSLGTSVPVIARGAAWRYLDEGTAAADWASPGFDDDAWPEGDAELGYGDGDETTTLYWGTNPNEKRVAYYFRTRFEAPATTDLAALEVGLVVDDGAVVYLNGTELFRYGMPVGAVTPTTRASLAAEGSAESAVHRFVLPTDLLVAGQNVLAVEVHQVSQSSSDISFDLALSARYVFGDPVERTASTEASFEMVPTADAEMVAVFESVEASILPAAVSLNLLLERVRSPYYVEGEVVVGPGATLAAEPGVEILMAPGSGIRAEGRIELAGTEALPVRIRSLYPGEAWGTICLEGGAEWSSLEHVRISGSGPATDPCPAALTALDTRVRLRHVTFDEVHLPVRADDSELEVFESLFSGVTGVGDYIEVNRGQLVLEGSEFTGNDLVDMDAVDMGSMRSGTVIRGNRFHHFTGFNSDGVDLGEGSTDILVEGNLFHDLQDKAVSVGQGSTVTVVRNTVVRTGIGVGVKDSLSFASVVHTTFHDADIGVAVYEKHPDRGGASAEVYGSLFSRSRTAAVQADHLSTISIAWSLSDTGPLPGPDNLLADPRLLDPDGLNAALQVTSPAIDAGDPADATDPDGSRADIGARPFAGTRAVPVVLNEIAYNPPPDFDTDDWIELHNPSQNGVDLSGWVLRDEADEPTFVFADPSALDGRGYLVLSRRPDLFGALLPGAPAPFGTLRTGLSGAGEGLWLYDADGMLVDSVRYGDVWPWPTAADGNGSTLELIDPLLDNAQPTSWRASAGRGTPGWRNSMYVSSEDPGGGDLPADFELHQGYPNPFNPSTRIRYAVPSASRVRIEVYDALGRRVGTLLDGTLEGGRHEILWTASGLASGVYFVTMHADPLAGGRGYRATRRSVLLR